MPQASAQGQGAEVCRPIGPRCWTRQHCVVSDPETRQFQLDASVNVPSGDSDSGSGDSTELSVSDIDESKGKKKREKKKPGKLPKGFQKGITDNSRDAADNALKRFFSGG